MQKNEKFIKKTQNSQHFLSASKYAYLLGMKTTTVYNIMSGRCADNDGVLESIKAFDTMFNDIRDKNIAKRKRASEPVSISINQPS